MGRKLVVLFLVLFAVSMGSLSAQEQLESNTPSEFDVGIILNYSYADLRDQNFKEYIPTLRFQWNMLPWLGLSATGYVNGEEYASLVVEAVLRAPLGLIEPYVATGPGYLVALSEDVPVSGTSNFAYNFLDWSCHHPFDSGCRRLLPEHFHCGHGLSERVQSHRNRSEIAFLA